MRLVQRTMHSQQSSIVQELHKNDKVLVNWLKQYLGDIETALDIKQNAFLQIWQYSSHTKVDNPKALMFTIARHLAYNEIRRRKRFDAKFVTMSDYSEVEVEQVTCPEELSPEQMTSVRNDIQRVLKEIDSLPKNPKRAIIMHRIENQSYKKIAQRLGVSESSVEKYIIYALRHLRKCFGPEQGHNSTMVAVQSNLRPLKKKVLHN